MDENNIKNNKSTAYLNQCLYGYMKCLYCGCNIEIPKNDKEDDKTMTYKQYLWELGLCQEKCAKECGKDLHTIQINKIFNDLLKHSK